MRQVQVQVQVDCSCKSIPGLSCASLKRLESDDERTQPRPARRPVAVASRIVVPSKQNTKSAFDQPQVNHAQIRPSLFQYRPRPSPEGPIVGTSESPISPSRPDTRSIFCLPSSCPCQMRLSERYANPTVTLDMSPLPTRPAFFWHENGHILLPDIAYTLLILGIPRPRLGNNFTNNLIRF